MVASTGLEMGNTILANTVIWVAPSILADSMMESGMVVRKKVREIVTLNEETHKGENQGPQGVGHVQHLAHHHVVGNHAAAEDHGG